MMIQLRNKMIPQSLTGHMLVDANKLPRVFALAHMMTWGSISDSTKTARLRAIDRAYYAFERRTNEDCLDGLLGRQEIQRITDTLEGWYFELNGCAQDQRISNRRIWKWAVEFITASLEASSPARALDSRDYQRILTRLRAFKRMKLGKGPRTFRPRSLPESVIDEIFSIMDPTSKTNPFRTAAIAFRNYVILLTAYELGLRRGELAMLPVDAIKEQFDSKMGQRRQWVTIDYNPYEEDGRSTIPSLKTKTSKRILPVSFGLFQMITTYRNDFRGRPTHSFLYSSRLEKPLSMPSINRVFAIITDCLSSQSKSALFESCGKTTVSPHDLRHTSVVLRLKRIVAGGKSLSEAIEDLRVFYGWAKDSDMPQHYARAYFEGELSEQTSERIELAVETVRANYKGR